MEDTTFGNDPLINIIITLCGGFLVVIVGIIGWIGSMIFRKLDSNEKGLNEVKVSVTRIEAKYDNLASKDKHNEQQLTDIKNLLIKKQLT